ncbi:MAG: DNA polymerase III subunit gamma/tau [Patescibacteria group bacterium]
MAVLYQKYRPQKFSEILGQNNIKITLQNEILHNKIAHAYLFCGPRAVGKTTLARVLAKAVNCTNRKENEYEPCNNCESCLSINGFSNLDVVEIDAASNTGVDNVRENIISLSRIISTNNKYKVFIIDEVHMLSLSAFNALLKTLEEPPANVIFILCTTEAYKVPLTIISRCERFDFKKISTSDMILKLENIVKKEKIKADREVLELIASKSDGHLRDAESLLSQIISISDNEINMTSASLVIPYNNLEENINFLKFLSKKDAVSAIELVNNLFLNGVNLKIFLTDLIELLRKMILSKMNNSLSTTLGLDLSEKMEIKISELSSQFEINELIFLSEKFLDNLRDIGSHFIPQMPVELSVIDFCGNNKVDNIKKNPELENIKPIQKKISKSNLDESVSEEKNKENSHSKIESSNLSSLNKGILSLDEILNLWPEFLMKLKPHNHSLSFVMQSCQISSINSNKICLAFKYKLHKDRLDNPEIKNIINKILKDVYKTDLTIEAIIDGDSKNDNPSNMKSSNNEAIENILKTFGGQVIN